MKIFNKASIITASFAVVFGLIGVALAATNVNLGTADDFAVLAGAGITNTGPTTITGNVGTFPTTTETGFGSITLNGVDNAGNAVTQTAKDDLVTAYNDAAGQLPVKTVPSELGGTTKTAGIYNSNDGKFGITGTLTLDAQGDPGAVFIFKTASTLVTASSSKIVLKNNAQACHVFWQVTSSATLGTNSSFSGNILALTSITLTTGATVEGSVLARNGAVTLDSNTISRAVCGSNSSFDTSSDIKVKKEASKTSLKSGPAKVTFTYRVTNEGKVALTDLSVKDDKCDDVEFIKGDDNDDEKLDMDEEWKYECKKTVKQTETNIVTAKGTANGDRIKDTDEATVTVSTPGLPSAGVGSTFWDSILNYFSF